MENRVELFAAELFPPIQGGQVLGDEIAPITAKIFEITRPKIVDDREPGVWEFFLQRQREIRADETGATSDNKIEGRVQF